MDQITAYLPGILPAFSSRPLVRVHGAARRWIQGSLGVLFAFAGVNLLTSRA